MAGESYQPSVVSRREDNELTEMAQESIESQKISHEQAVQIVRLAETTYLNFKKTSQWDESLVDKLFERIAGSTAELTEELRDKMLDLYLQSRSSSFVQDDNRRHYKEVFEYFTRNGYDVATIQAVLSEQEPNREFSTLHIAQRIYLVLNKMNMHEE